MQTQPHNRPSSHGDTTAQTPWRNWWLNRRVHWWRWWRSWLVTGEQAVESGAACFGPSRTRGEIGYTDQVKLDVEFLEAATFLLEIKILAETVPAAWPGRRAC